MLGEGGRRACHACREGEGASLALAGVVCGVSFLLGNAVRFLKLCQWVQP